MSRNYPRPRMKIRNKKRRHPTWRMTPEERQLWFFINEELLKMYTEELNRVILYGDGSFSKDAFSWDDHIPEWEALWIKANPQFYDNLKES